MCVLVWATQNASAFTAHRAHTYIWHIKRSAKDANKTQPLRNNSIEIYVTISAFMCVFVDRISVFYTVTQAPNIRGE